MLQNLAPIWSPFLARLPQILKVATCGFLGPTSLLLLLPKGWHPLLQRALHHHMPWKGCSRTDCSPSLLPSFWPLCGVHIRSKAIQKPSTIPCRHIQMESSGVANPAEDLPHSRGVCDHLPYPPVAEKNRTCRRKKRGQQTKWRREAGRGQVGR